MGNTTDYRVAALQLELHRLRKEENIAHLLAMAEEAIAHGAKLIVTPEMATTGYIWSDRREIASLVESIPGPTTDAFKELAHKHRWYIVMGLAEAVRDSNIYYNSGALVGPEGVLGVHRKIRLYGCDTRWAREGDLGLQVWKRGLGTIGILICMDIMITEAEGVSLCRGLT